MNILFSGNNGIADLPVRIAFGAVFIAHGGQKLFGWWGGYGLEATGQWMASIGLEPGFAMAMIAGGIEFFGGIALILGVITRPVAMAASLLMLVALMSRALARIIDINNAFCSPVEQSLARTPLR